MSARAVRTHGLTKSIAYRSWASMKSRCADPHATHYDNYGGRGIRVCERWRGSFEAFLADMGERPSTAHSLDRIDRDGHYEPGNVRWADKATQSNNRRSTVMLTYDGQTLPAGEWARLRGIKLVTLKARLRRGLPVSDVLAPADLRR